MGRGDSVSIVASASAPWVSPPAVSGGGGFDKEDQWRSLDNSVSAVSFGFVATAILISMFLVMAIFERLLRPSPPPTAATGGSNPGEVETGKLDYPSPKMTIYSNGVSVLMPGEKIPTYIAHPAPAPCPPECVSRPTLYHDMFPGPGSS
ncbi:hypothetical protein ACJIZ3_010766 [Penstemon smallii]|uniref:Transmembrane protein n=1 Tax=Penstemon smallii TaxID=265156 RepID=A0ABD3UH74_9LAMI